MFGRTKSLHWHWHTDNDGMRLLIFCKAPRRGNSLHITLVKHFGVGGVVSNTQRIHYSIYFPRAGFFCRCPNGGTTEKVLYGGVEIAYSFLPISWFFFFFITPPISGREGRQSEGRTGDGGEEEWISRPRGGKGMLSLGL